VADGTKERLHHRDELRTSRVAVANYVALAAGATYGCEGSNDDPPGGCTPPSPSAVESMLGLPWLVGTDDLRSASGL
jgi:hypothetical protein